MKTQRPASKARHRARAAITHLIYLRWTPTPNKIYYVGTFLRRPEASPGTARELEAQEVFFFFQVFEA